MIYIIVICILVGCVDALPWLALLYLLVIVAAMIQAVKLLR
jgi:hypothetical protein